MNPHAYSKLFSCLYDEKEPVGCLGRGTHYSVFRSVEWLDVVRSPVIGEPQIHDFAVLWDEDHDTRVIGVVESIYMAGMLSPIQFIGERKGTLTIIVAAKFYWDCVDIQAYEESLQQICNGSTGGDWWPVEVGQFDRSYGSPHQTDLKHLVQAQEERVITYVRNIDSLWSLGTKPFDPRAHSSIVNSSPAIPVPPPPPPIFFGSK